MNQVDEYERARQQAAQEGQITFDGFEPEILPDPMLERDMRRFEREQDIYPQGEPPIEQQMREFEIEQVTRPAAWLATEARRRALQLSPDDYRELESSEHFSEKFWEGLRGEFEDRFPTMDFEQFRNVFSKTYELTRQGFRYLATRQVAGTTLDEPARMLRGVPEEDRQAFEFILNGLAADPQVRGRLGEDIPAIAAPVRGLKAGMNALAENVGRLLGGQQANEFFDYTRRAGRVRRMARGPEAKSFVGKAAVQAAEMAPEMAISAALTGPRAAGVLTRLAGPYLYWFNRMIPDAYEEYRSFGIDDTSAAIGAAITSAAEAGIELMVSPARMLGIGVRRKALAAGRQSLSRWLLKQGADFGKEFSEEIFQDGSRLFIAAALESMDKDVDIDWERVIGQRLKDLPQTALSLAFVMGPARAVAGGRMGLEELGRAGWEPMVRPVQPEKPWASTEFEKPERAAEFAREYPELTAKLAETTKTLSRRDPTLRQVAKFEKNTGENRQAVVDALRTAKETEDARQVQEVSEEGARLVEAPREEREPARDLYGRERGEREGVPEAEGREAAEEAVVEEPPPTEPPEARPSAMPAGGLELPVSLEAAPAQPISEHAIVAGLGRIWDVTIRSGRVGGTAAGIYKNVFGRTAPEVIRTKRGFEGNLAVVAHEIAHHIDRRTGIRKAKMPKAVKDEVQRLDYEPNMRRTHEGFAEYARHALTMDDAAEIAPEFHKWFTEQWRPANPELAEKWDQTRDLISRWRAQGAMARGLANISQTRRPAQPEGITRTAWWGERLAYAGHRFYAAMKDELHFGHLFDTSAHARGGADKPGRRLWDILMAFSQAGPTYADRAMKNGPFFVSNERFGQQAGPAFADVFTEIDPNERAEFEVAVWARHAKEAWAKGVNPGMSKEDADWIHENYWNDRYERAANTWTAYNNGLLDVLADSGAISQETADHLKDYWKTFIPLRRLLPASSRALRMGKHQMGNLPTPLRRRLGSGLGIISPLQVTIERSIWYYQLAMQREAAKRAVERAEEVGQMGAWVEPVAPKVRPTRFSIEEILPQLEKAGVDREMLAEVDPEDALTIWRPDYHPRGVPVERVRRGDKWQLYQFHPDLHRAILGIQYYQLPPWLDMTIGRMTRMVKLGATTLSPTFMARNQVRDFMTYLFQSPEIRTIGQVGTPAEMLAGYIFTMAQHLRGKKGDPLVELGLDMGISLSATLGLDYHRIERSVRDIMADNTQRRALNIVRSPVDSLRDIISTTELSSRIAEFKHVLGRHGFTRGDIDAGNLPPREVLIEAVNAAHDVTVNFKRLGSVGKLLNRLIPYWNAPVESADKFVRVWRDHPQRAFFWSASLATATLMYWLARKDDDDYQEQPDWLKYGYWTATDDDGKSIVRVPRPFEWGWTMSAGIEAILNAAYRREPHEIGRWASAFVESAAPPIAPSPRPIVEAYFNYDTWRDRPIVPPHELEAIEPRYQYRPWTTELMKAFGDYLNVSPAKLEHVLEGQTGGMFTAVVRPIEQIVRGEQRQPAEWPIVRGFAFSREYSDSVDRFYERANEVNQEIDAAERKGKVPYRLKRERKRLNRYRSWISQLRKGARDLRTREERFEYEQFVIGLARKALRLPKLERYPVPTRGQINRLVRKARRRQQ